MGEAVGKSGSPSWARFFGPVVMLAFLVAQSFDIQSYPLVNYDAVFLNDAGLQLVAKGEFRADVLSQNPGFEHHYLWQPPALALSSAASYWLFGFGIWQTRLASILFGGMALWALFQLVRSIQPGSIGAAVAALSLFVMPPWVVTAKDARMDTGAVLLLFLGTAAFLRTLDENCFRKAWTSFAAGLCVGGAALFHTAVVTWAFGLFIVIAIFHRRNLGLLLAYALGAALPVALWLLYCLQYPNDFLQQYAALLSDRVSHQSVWQRLLGEGQRYAATFKRAPTFLLLVLAGTYGLLAHSLWRSAKVLALIVLTGSVALLNALVVGGSFSGYYILYPLALVLCLAGIGIDPCLSRHVSGRVMRAVAASCVALFLVNGAAISLGPRLLAYAYQGPERDYGRQFAALSQILKPGDQVWGAAPTWYAVVKSGARLDAFEPIPPWQKTQPDPRKHKYVVVDHGASFDGMTDYVKVRDFGADLPKVLGAPLTNKGYRFDLWQSKLMP
ncbi:Dolichyl-phosphate-mannose-protein mannosyltransferase [Enhydrobacter aerosaccus]|uniref:Dolichyl-phosphate-mannose-protein mannosyltransferase n=1 Tax=Enhydrobacter aerosaccus TaxID=225324 RepID=A0A1T4L9J6_9HYPH|nr:glycosyltransferase family 39 protein [Enhydrobacter aerosaccus]SJZ51425.1 Dolichyl-phosphate-mannose-protein mannosyltransferase [Enhydrobacter aerosaccus]